LDISEWGVTDAGLQNLPRGLRSLSLAACPLIHSVPNLPAELQSLDLSGLTLTEDAIKHLPAGLTRLTLNGCVGVANADWTMLQELERLELDGASGVTAATLANLPQLTSLSLRDCTGVTVEAFSHFPQSLKSLSLWGCSGLTKDIPPLPPGLTHLNVMRTRADDTILNQLPKTLRSLNLAGCAITDAGLLNLPFCANLVELDISWTKVTDKGLAVLAGRAPQLRLINVSNTPITREGLIIYIENQLTGVRVLRGAQLNR